MSHICLGSPPPLGLNTDTYITIVCKVILVMRKNKLAICFALKFQQGLRGKMLQPKGEREKIWTRPSPYLAILPLSRLLPYSAKAIRPFSIYLWWQILKWKVNINKLPNPPPPKQCRDSEKIPSVSVVYVKICSSNTIVCIQEIWWPVGETPGYW